MEVKLKALRKAGAEFELYNRIVRKTEGQPASEKDREMESYLKTKITTTTLETILQASCLGRALWAMRCIPGAERDARHLAVHFARRVRHLMGDDPRFDQSIEMAEQAADENLPDYNTLADARSDAAWATICQAERETWAAARDGDLERHATALHTIYRSIKAEQTGHVECLVSPALAAALDSAAEAAFQTQYTAVCTVTQAAEQAAEKLDLTTKSKSDRPARRAGHQQSKEDEEALARKRAIRKFTSEAAENEAAAQREIFLAMCRGEAPWQS